MQTYPFALSIALTALMEICLVHDGISMYRGERKKKEMATLLRKIRKRKMEPPLMTAAPLLKKYEDIVKGKALASLKHLLNEAKEPYKKAILRKTESTERIPLICVDGERMNRDAEKSLIKQGIIFAFMQSGSSSYKGVYVLFFPQ